MIYIILYIKIKDETIPQYKINLSLPKDQLTLSRVEYKSMIPQPLNHHCRASSKMCSKISVCSVKAGIALVITEYHGDLQNFKWLHSLMCKIWMANNDILICNCAYIDILGSIAWSLYNSSHSIAFSSVNNHIYIYIYITSLYSPRHMHIFCAILFLLWFSTLVDVTQIPPCYVLGTDGTLWLHRLLYMLFLVHTSREFKGTYPLLPVYRWNIQDVLYQTFIVTICCNLGLSHLFI